MNISHLIGKQVCVVQYSHCGSEVYVHGKLIRHKNGKFIVFNSSLFFYFLKSLFCRQPRESFVSFPWTAVSKCIGNHIFIFDITEEQMADLFQEFKEKTLEEDK